MKKVYYVGIDIGSTTVKVAVLDTDFNLVFDEYRRHFAHIQETLCQILKNAREKLGDIYVYPGITGSGSMSLGKQMNIEFIQEVTAVASALKRQAPQTHVAIELGGEDAKIIYFEQGGVEERMNGVCAGGTGSFIDQMASLLQTDAMGLNEHAKNYSQIYSIAARCGVFAKSDIQPLINDGATLENLSASVFQAVVNQTISGLACGKPIYGNVAFLGGPLHFLTELKSAFVRTLKLKPDEVVELENPHLFAAIGTALEVKKEKTANINDLIDRLDKGIELTFELKRLDPLFKDQHDYDTFKLRHDKNIVKKEDISTYCGNCYLGIDAGSTTTKLVLIGEKGQILWSYYSPNNGSPINTTIKAIKELNKVMPNNAVLCRSCSTGYGEMLLKAAFMLDDGEVETIAHYTAASFFDNEVDCVLDIGGQDMKYIKIKNGYVENIVLNEACSSGCGSFIENFANSLDYTAQDFAEKALFAKNPIDLGTRCTVFMNSNVKQAQKEGASVEDISAGLAYSVIKNALFKVIKLSDTSSIGNHVIVQGGTFHNKAVLRAFENITGIHAICPDISGLMGAFGAALIAKDRFKGEKSEMLSFEEIINFNHSTETTRCKGCSNNCMLTINKFSDGRKYISGNRCEKLIKGNDASKDVPNLMAYKLKRIFDYKPLSAEAATRGVIGIPRVLNIYENYPFWATFFKELKFSVILSPNSDRKIFELGMDSIPSESECYPAKIAHGHVQWLIDHGVETIFHPSVFYEHKEVEKAQNNYNCPMVIAYPENIKNNIEDIINGKVAYHRPFISFASEKTASKRLCEYFGVLFNIPESETKAACKKAWTELAQARQNIKDEGQKALKWIKENNKKGIIIAGRPYHIDPEINHGIPELITSYGLAVLTEDSISIDQNPERPLRVNDQWVFHSRLYNAAEYICDKDYLELIQLNSFGCGLDAVTTDQVAEILENNNKMYTLLKIDEVNNLGAARIRIRSLIAAIKTRGERGIKPDPRSNIYERSVFTKKMHDEKWTIIAPNMSPIHFELIKPVFEMNGYNLIFPEDNNRSAVDMGLKYVNNDACYPSLITVGQIMATVLSGKYDSNKLAIMMSQTGGCCRASNYVGFIRRALDNVNLGHIPVISLNLNGMEKNPGFKVSPKLLSLGVCAVVYGDILMRCLYRVRPYEKVKGSANKLYEKWNNRLIKSLTSGHHSISVYKKNCQNIVKDFDNLEIDETIKKPRVGIVGEILVKYMPIANNHLVDILEQEGAEVVVPDLIGFFEYCAFGNDYRHKYLGGSLLSKELSKGLIKLIQIIRSPATKALRNSKRFEEPVSIFRLAELAKSYLSIGNQYGEGWFLCSEMIELILNDAPNIVCIQPFGCLPNHVVGKGVTKRIKKNFPQANIVAVDYDPGASEVNQLNRIKLMLSNAVKNYNKANNATQMAEVKKEKSIK